MTDQVGADATAAVATKGPEPTGATPTVVGPAPLGAAGTVALGPASNGPGRGADATVRQAVPATKASRRIEPPPYVETGPKLSKAGRRRRRRWPYLVLLLVLLAGGGGAGTYVVISNRLPSHPLPSVVDQPELEAANALRKLGFEVDTRQEYFDGSIPGLVRLQQPEGGGDATLKEGKTVTLVVSKGPPPTPVPDLANLDEDGARKALDDVGHVLGTVTHTNHETVAEGIVLEWTKKGETPPKGATIDLVVSDGPAPRQIPAVAGKSYDEAVASLAGVGLEADRVDVYTDDDGSAGKVISSTPAAGENASAGVGGHPHRVEGPALGAQAQRALGRRGHRRPGGGGARRVQQVRPVGGRGLPQPAERGLQGEARLVGDHLPAVTGSPG